MFYSQETTSSTSEFICNEIQISSYTKKVFGEGVNYVLYKRDHTIYIDGYTSYQWVYYGGL